MCYSLWINKSTRSEFNQLIITSWHDFILMLVHWYLEMLSNHTQHTCCCGVGVCSDRWLNNHNDQAAALVERGGITQRHTHCRSRALTLVCGCIDVDQQLVIVHRNQALNHTFASVDTKPNDLGARFGSVLVFVSFESTSGYSAKILECSSSQYINTLSVMYMWQIEQRIRDTTFIQQPFLKKKCILKVNICNRAPATYFRWLVMDRVWVPSMLSRSDEECNT